jgi:hypothetical protein
MSVRPVGPVLLGHDFLTKTFWFRSAPHLCESASSVGNLPPSVGQPQARAFLQIFFGGCPQMPHYFLATILTKTFWSRSATSHLCESASSVGNLPSSVGQSQARTFLQIFFGGCPQITQITQMKKTDGQVRLTHVSSPGGSCTSWPRLLD